jgi:GxxExxY protein
MLKEEQDKITHEIIGCAMEVHKILGNGFQEVVYQRALSVEMTDCSIKNLILVILKILRKSWFRQVIIKK